MTDTNKTNENADFSRSDLARSCEVALNDSGTREKIGTHLTQNRSPGVLGWTYFVRVDDAIKIGSASKFKDRLHALQTAHEKPLDVLAVLPAALVDEYKTHQLFAHLRVRGEWFRADRELLYFIEQAKLEAVNEPKPAPVRPPPPKVKPQPRYSPEIQDTRRDLIALRVKHGADTPIGHRCSNIVEMLRRGTAAADQIMKQTEDLGRLLSQVTAIDA